MLCVRGLFILLYCPLHALHSFDAAQISDYHNLSELSENSHSLINAGFIDCVAPGNMCVGIRYTYEFF